MDFHLTAKPSSPAARKVLAHALHFRFPYQLVHA